MKKLLGIFLITFVVVGFSGTVSAADVSSFPGFVFGPTSILFAPNIIFAPHFVIGTIINSPGSIIAGGNVVSITGGDTFNAFGSGVTKSTNNFGGIISTVGNRIFI